jgi:glycosyltransferase involved in cell wall biosynthesis
MIKIFITQGWFQRGAEVALKNYILLNPTDKILILNLSNRPYSIENVEETLINLNSNNQIFGFYLICKFFFSKIGKIDKVIYVNGKITLISLILTILKLIKPKIKLIIWEHCIISEHWNVKYLIKKLIIKISYYWLLFLSNSILVPSKIIENKISIFKKKISIQANPLIINTNSSFIKLNPFPDFKINIIFVGSLSIEKNPYLFIDFIKSLIVINPNICGHIFGEGPLQNDLAKKISKLNLNDKIYFHGWKSNIHDYMNIADLLVVTSQFETYCNVIMESISIGCPVISTNWDGVKLIYGNQIMYFEDNWNLDLQLTKRNNYLLEDTQLNINKFTF